MRVVRWIDAASFRARAEAWLVRSEAEHNLLLGLVDQLEADPSLFDPPLYLATVEEGDQVVLAAVPARSDRWARIGYVYTPTEIRGRGYATALAWELTAFMLAQGRRSAVLYTNLANPTSNAIYHRIGYRPVVDVVDVLLSPDVGG